MKYLATGLPPSTRRFAFCRTRRKIHTTGEHLGIRPIVYPNKVNNHQSLVKAVKRWAELMGDNYITKKNAYSGYCNGSPVSRTGTIIIHKAIN